MRSYKDAPAAKPFRFLYWFVFLTCTPIVVSMWFVAFIFIRGMYQVHFGDNQSIERQQQQHQQHY
jgi:hypothetical protein